MYTDEDLDYGVKEGFFTQNSVEQFRSGIATQRQTSLQDEENFRLITGFNDVFVVIASGLLLASVAWIGFQITPMLGTACVAFVSWLLAEFFVYRRRMALPAIVLLLSFLGGVFATPIVWSEQPNEYAFMIAGALTLFAALIHWRRFRVPITVAASVVALSVSVGAAIITIFPFALAWVNTLMLTAGLFIFGLAMYWDASDKERKTRSSDVAFWLHLASAPMIVHPIFSSMGILDGVGGLYSSLAVVALYILLAMVSIAVDRRAIMISALVYVVYAFSTLLQTYGMVSYSFAITGVCIGGSLLLLSAFWQSSRKTVLRLLPAHVKQTLPSVQA
ncbi:hypothetical protein [Aliiglaciecola sp. M165]|uniref:hypothetical protein n=1 Tax=Aliiglaciecola sp. M165 TaxID=2593649 RepID=UPI001180ACEB|nr:hypothetical protein [Aliiglaciecola sp. M165]TRY29036.1 hypothetical protein FM019_19735 [Aliiglaciecola sp. M165]